MNAGTLSIIALVGFFSLLLVGFVYIMNAAKADEERKTKGPHHPESDGQFHQ